MSQYLLKQASLMLGGAGLAVALAATAAAAAAPPAAPPAERPDSLAEFVVMLVAPPSTTAYGKAAAPWDLTGNWVAIVNEDWRYRMVTPPKGDYASVPLTPAGKAAADAWDPATDGSCKAYGVGGIMRMPTRLKISWVNDNQLKIETDAGAQTREINFTPTPAPVSGPRTLQGYSTAEWRLPAPAGRAAQPAPPRSGSMKVITVNHTAGWLRKNGVPYSENAQITEFYDRWPGPDGSQWMSVTTVVTDPVNLNQPFFTSSHFRKEPDASKWFPEPCAAG